MKVGLCALKLERGWTSNIILETASAAWEMLRFTVGGGQP